MQYVRLARNPLRLLEKIRPRHGKCLLHMFHTTAGIVKAPCTSNTCESLGCLPSIALKQAMDNLCSTDVI